MVHVGIDIGTSNTVVALMQPGEEPAVRRIDGEVLVPSIVAVADVGGNPAVGRSGADEWANPDYNPDGIFRRWKLAMGEGKLFSTMQFGPGSTPVEITPEWLTTRLVEFVLAAVSGGTGGETVESVLITVPHGWRRDAPEKCRATRQAAAAAVVAGQPIAIHPTTVSEPVAAAAYWLWEAQRAGHVESQQFAGKHILVCDVGGGTFDLSLVQVGAATDPLTVVDAINSNYAGDYVTALLLARAVAQFNSEHHTELADDPDEILGLLSGSPDADLRSWFLELQRLQRDMSIRFLHAKKAGTVPKQKMSVTLAEQDGLERDIRFTVTPHDFLQTLEPFYDAGRELVKTFLKRHGTSPPYAVVFAGGGSRIAGVPDRIVGAALADLFDNSAVADVLDRITINDYKIDQAVALGAALVAGDAVRVEERLLCDIGLQVNLDESLAEHLGAAADAAVLMTPVLERGGTLPATFTSETYQLDMYVSGGKTLDVTVVVDDDPQHPWHQAYTVDVPDTFGEHPCSIVITADTDGVLHVGLHFIDGFSTQIDGRYVRERSGRSRLVVGIPGRQAPPSPEMVRISPQQFVDAVTSLRGG
jgi:molecular chaperone DnaK